MYASEIEALVNNEVSLVSGADTMICVTEAEAKEFRTRQKVPVHVLSHPACPFLNAPGFAGREGFLFVGRLLEPDAPNWRGLAWFIREVWPTDSPRPAESEPKSSRSSTSDV